MYFAEYPDAIFPPFSAAYLTPKISPSTFVYRAAPDSDTSAQDAVIIIEKEKHLCRNDVQIKVKLACCHDLGGICFVIS